MPENKGADSNQWDFFPQLVWGKTDRGCFCIFCLKSILDAKVPLIFHWEIGVLPVHVLLEVPPG